MEEKAPEPHFLLPTFVSQGHINPARHLALRLLRATGARVTVSTAVSAYRKMFPDAADEREHHDGAGVCYVPYSDGYDDGFDRATVDPTHYMSQFKLVGSRTLGAALARLRAAGRPVTRVLYTFFLPWVADVARDHGVPATLYWIQPVTVLAAYFHFFRSTDGVDRDIAAAKGDPWAAVRIPGLPPLRVRDLPSFLTISSDEDPYAFMLTALRNLIDVLGREDRPTVLANAFDAMEPDAVASLRQHGLDVIPVGPVLSFLDAAASKNGSAPALSNNDLFKQDGKGYLEWLDARPAGSVTYISFGSLSAMSKRQIAEVARGMAESGRPFLWVLRKDNRGEDDGNVCGDGGERGMVVEWCDQVKVLSHPAVGCFVTHCGWNSTLESVACGVPVVGVPQWSDQGTNAWLVEQLGSGVRAEVSDKDGVLEAGELRRCLDLATSEMVRAKAALWREKARTAVAEGGSSEMNLRAFVEQVAGGY